MLAVLAEITREAVPGAPEKLPFAACALYVPGTGRCCLRMDTQGQPLWAHPLLAVSLLELIPRFQDPTSLICPSILISASEILLYKVPCGLSKTESLKRK